MSKKSLSETIARQCRFFAGLDNGVRHLRNYQGLVEFLQEHYPDVYEDWKAEQSCQEPAHV